jgi:hypothetical protein
MFDLNSAIHHWRSALGAQSNFRDSDLDELEDHLREEIAALQTAGLTEEEAFLIASRRLGKPADLNGEFAIADPSRRRRFRLSWMITGALALAFLWLATDVLTNFGTGTLIRMPLGNGLAQIPTGLGWIASAIRIGLLILGGVLIWKLLATDSSSRRLKKLGGGTVIAASLLLAFLALATRAGSQLFFATGLSREGFLDVTATSALINLLVMLALPVILLVGLWRLVKP